ncbi:DUF58 domain-containing protein [Filibacter tadaridae]|uniref:DUF58 domain-containing protein n=1 Tax=Filibacter tadaridae TaxID=2483811 RepID=A0A3P5X6L9_9BACL|nr:DUF58 domain-containing protein [Filibacter tadaridae]VDC29923.1 hypothetical protein FILTAD_02475 [Filibacter tadaridae]
MKWTHYEEGFKEVYQAMGITLMFFLASLIAKQALLGACFAAGLAILVFQNMYYSKVGKDLKLLPQQQRSRFLIGSENDLVLEFENGQTPIWNGMLTLSIQDAVMPVVDKMDHFSGIFDFSVPFSAGKGEKVKVTIPLTGRKRGLSRIVRLTIEIPHLFGGGSILMELDDFVRQESLVYPKIVPFTGILQPAAFKPGEVEQRHALFHDVFQPVGTRDYVPSDRFDQIHWTASARMQKLQTKEFLPVTSQSVMFLVNGVEKSNALDDFEKKIERLASYADYCTRKNIPYSIALNLLAFGETLYMYVETGIGKAHYQKTLETLAQLSERKAKIPFENMMQRVEMAGLLPPTIVLITHEPERYDQVIKKWSKFNHVVVDCFYEGGKGNWDRIDSKENVLN